MALRPNVRSLAARKARDAAAAARRRAAAAAREAPPLAVRPTPRPAPPKPLALPAPPKPLALPAPGPGLPPQASKPRGGQFWTGKADAAVSPDDVARQQAEDVGTRFLSDEDLVAQLATDAPVPLPPEARAAQDWLARSLAKYYKTDFGSPDDPLRDLAARGLHYDPDMTPEKWKATVDSYLIEDPIEQILFPSNPLGGMPGAGSDLRGQTLAAMPWLAKQPVTDKVYGISSGGLDIGHFADEFANALNPEVSGLPMDLAVRRESLARMSFPQAVERVGRINQFRVKQMEDAAQALANSPAVQTFKEYPDAGYRWVELRAPGYQLPDGYTISREALPTEDGQIDWYQVLDAEGNAVGGGGDEGEALKQAFSFTERDPRNVLQEALKYEGDTMGHCVGGYCDDVLSGRSRIFSLRDAKGQPHVTIETSPATRGLSYEDSVAMHQRAAEELGLVQPGQSMRMDAFPQERMPEVQQIVRRLVEERDAQLADTFDIKQIKGKQNRAPVDDYLPFVQDFVKGGTWGNVGDLGNTGLVKLPDGRYITQQQWQEGLAAIEAPWRNPGQYDERYLDRLSQAEWQSMLPYFEGYAIGGRVNKDRCFSRHPMRVR